MTGGIQEVRGIAPSLWASEECVILEADSAIYPTPAAIAAGYKFTDLAFVWLQSAALVGRYYICIKPKAAAIAAGELANAFINELLDQTLRLQLNEQFGPLRALITAQAFAEGNLLNAASDPADRADESPLPRG